MFLESVSSNPRWWYPPRSLVLQEDIKPRSLDCNLAFHKEVAHPFACLGASFSRGVRPLSYSVFFATCCASRRHRLYRGCASHRHRQAWQLMGTSLGELDWCQDHCMKMFLLHGVFEDNGGDRRGSHCQLGIHSEGGLGFHSNGDGEGVGELTMVLASAWNLRSVTRSIFHRHDVLQMRMRDVKCCKRIFRHDWSRPGQLKYRP